MIKLEHINSYLLRRGLLIVNFFAAGTLALLLPQYALSTHLLLFLHLVIYRIYDDLKDNETDPESRQEKLRHERRSLISFVRLVFLFLAVMFLFVGNWLWLVFQFWFLVGYQVRGYLGKTVKNFYPLIKYPALLIIFGTALSTINLIFLFLYLCLFEYLDDPRWFVRDPRMRILALIILTYTLLAPYALWANVLSALSIVLLSVIQLRGRRFNKIILLILLGSHFYLFTHLQEVVRGINF